MEKGGGKWVAGPKLGAVMALKGVLDSTWGATDMEFNITAGALGGVRCAMATVVPTVWVRGWRGGSAGAGDGAVEAFGSGPKPFEVFVGVLSAFVVGAGVTPALEYVVPVEGVEIVPTLGGAV